MLSYRHAFHAGNFADVLKHIVVVDILAHLVKKAKPFAYIDTHAGAGLYDLHSGQAKMLGEHADGIGKLTAKEFPELAAYFDVIRACNKPGKLDFYPGSPLIARHYLRPHDRAWLYELHPYEFRALGNNMGNNRAIKIFCEDGINALASLLPPTSRRGLVLIDPSYEMKSDYEQVFIAVEKACKKFATGIYAVWYPVVDRSRIDLLEKRFIASGIKNIQQFELGVAPDTHARGMTAAGMFVVNPPWTLFERMSAVLPRLARTLGHTGEAFYKCNVLTGE